MVLACTFRHCYSSINLSLGCLTQEEVCLRHTASPAPELSPRACSPGAPRSDPLADGIRSLRGPTWRSMFYCAGKIYKKTIPSSRASAVRVFLYSKIILLYLTSIFIHFNCCSVTGCLVLADNLSFHLQLFCATAPPLRKGPKLILTHEFHCIHFCFSIICPHYKIRSESPVFPPP